jgi:uncharacterized OB-fold protein
MRILPGVDDMTGPYWAAAADHRLVMQYCAQCGFTGYPPVPSCPRCHTRELTWREVSGRGSVHAYTTVYHPVHPVMAESLPYTLVLVDLAEGPRMLTKLRDCAPEDVSVGLAVEVVYDDVTDGIALPQFRPASPTSERTGS